MILTVAGGKAFDFARFQVPGVVGLGKHASEFAIDLEPLVPIYADGDGQIKVADRAAGKAAFDEPTPGAKAFDSACPHPFDRSPEVARRIDQVTAVAEQVIPGAVGFGIAGWFARGRTRDD